MIGTGMTEPFFFNRGRGLSVREIAALTGATPRPGADLDRRITGIAALDQAAPSDLAFLDKAKYASPLSASGAGACLTTEPFAGRPPVAAIGPNVRLGRQCSIGANASITNSLIGDRVVVHPGCAIGQDGFGFVMGATGHRKVLQMGRVIIQDDVEIGAGTTIDRGANRDTVIGEGTKIDNLVQIGHNVRIGRHCIIVSQCGISGSVVIEDRVILAGQVGLADNVTIGEGAIIGARSGVKSDVPPGEKWFGYPAMRGSEYFRRMMTLRDGVSKHDGADK